VVAQPLERRIQELLIQQSAIHRQTATVIGEDQAEVGPEVQTLEFEQMR
jgi:hypothetical protein